jgi:hypothetical protein
LHRMSNPQKHEKTSLMLYCFKKGLALMSQTDSVHDLKELSVIIGLPLSIARRAADMRGFHFGKIKSHRSGTSGEFALHIQCAWRIEGSEGIITGYGDLWKPKDEDEWEEDWDYEKGENLQDWKLKELLGSYDSKTRSPVNLSEKLIVESVEITTLGDLIIKLSGGYQIVTFSECSRGEMWRFFSPGTDDDHICMIL